MNLSETIRRAFRAEADSRMDSAGGYRREPWRAEMAIARVANFRPEPNGVGRRFWSARLNDETRARGRKEDVDKNGLQTALHHRNAVDCFCLRQSV
jgi:hypothetical protein